MPVSELKRAGGRAASPSSRPPAVAVGRTPNEGGPGGVGPEKLFTMNDSPDHGLFSSRLLLASLWLCQLTPRTLAGPRA